MGATVATCRCGYKSERLYDGDGERFIAICDQCSAVVNPKFIPFEFTLPPCPNCGRTVQASQYRYQLVLFHKYGSRPILENCPRCKIGILTFEVVMSISWRLDEIYPRLGQIVHGFYNGKSIEIPGVIANHSCQLESLENYLPNQVMELRVADVSERETSSAKSVNFQFTFIRYLSKSDLGFKA